MPKENKIINQTIQLTLHTGGEGKLPVMHQRALSWLVTMTGETVAMLLSLFEPQLKILWREDEEKSLDYADLCIPLKSGKSADGFLNIRNREEGFIRIFCNGGEYPRGRKPLTFSNTYNIVEYFTDEVGKEMLRIRLYESVKRLVEVEREGKKKTEEKIDYIQTSANFLQAALTTYLDFSWSRIPEIVRGPSLKQAAEQLMSYVAKLRKSSNESFPSIDERDPEGVELEWWEKVKEIAEYTEGFEYKPAREVYPKDYALAQKGLSVAKKKDPAKVNQLEQVFTKKWERKVNTTGLWKEFCSSPFPDRMALKLQPENCVVYRRRWQDAGGGMQDRLYVAIPVFGGLAENDKARRELWHSKMVWWQSRLSEFIPTSLWRKGVGKRATLIPNNDTILLPLEYDRQKDGSSIAERTLCDADNWAVCLGTLCEKRARVGIKSFDGNLLHRSRDRGESYRSQKVWRLDLSVGFDKPTVVFPNRILALHFSDSPIITWTLGEIKDDEPFILERGVISGNLILDEALAAQTRLEMDAGKLKWVGGREYRGVIQNRTRHLRNMIVGMAIEKGAQTALEKIEWVEKRKGGPDMNKRFSMWNFATLFKEIGWYGFAVTKRHPSGASAPMCCFVKTFEVWKRHKDQGGASKVPDELAADLVFQAAVEKVIAARDKSKEEEVA